MTTDLERQVARHLAPVMRRLAALEQASGLGHSSIEDGAIEEYDADGVLRQIIGKQPDGTSATSVVNGPPPPTPAGMVVEATAGGLTVGWAGEFVDGAVAPMDFARVEVHASTEPGFTPDRDSIRATFESAQGGQVYVPLGLVEHEVCLVARAMHGKPSEASVRELATPLPLIDGQEVADLIEWADGADGRIADLVDNVIPSLEDGVDWANGRVTASTDAPTASDATGKPEGALWYRYTGNALVGAWRLVSGEWVPAPLDRTFVPTIDIGTGTFGDLDGVRIKARSVLADALAVGGPGGNLITDPTFSDPDLRDVRQVAGQSSWGDTDQPASTHSMLLAHSTTNNTTGWLGTTNDARGAIPVTPGQKVVFGVWVRGNSEVRWRWTASLYHSDGTTTHASVGQPYLAPSDTSTWVEHEYTVPDDVVGVIPRPQRARSGTNGATDGPSHWVRFEQPSLRVMTPGVLIEDGAIDAEKLAANLALLTNIIAGDPDGGRVELGPFGLRKYAADGTSIDVDMSQDGQAVFSGTITGSDIVGSRIRTAMSGPRVEIDGAQPDRILWHTGDGSETKPGEVIVGRTIVDGNEPDLFAGRLSLEPPQIGSDLYRPYFSLVSRRPGTSLPSRAELRASWINLDGQVNVYGKTVLMGDGTAVEVSGDLVFTDGGSIAGTTLSTENLNSVTTPGLYYQPSNVNATSGRNYPPDLLAGVLEVMALPNRSHVYQRYTTYRHSSLPGVTWTRVYTGSWSPWRVLGNIEVPGAQVASGQSTNTITATSWATFPGVNVSVDVTVPAGRTLLTSIEFGGWFVKPVGVDLRCSVMGGGATSLAANAPNWGAVLWGSAGVEVGSQMFATRTIQLGAGTTTLSMVAYRSGSGGAANINYPVMTVTPLRWV